MQQDVLLHLWAFFYTELMQNTKKNILLCTFIGFFVYPYRKQAFKIVSPSFWLSTPMENCEATWKKCHKQLIQIFCSGA